MVGRRVGDAVGLCEKERQGSTGPLPPAMLAGSSDARHAEFIRSVISVHDSALLACMNWSIAHVKPLIWLPL